MSQSETAKHRDKVINYCNGNGLDLGSAGDPIRPESIQVELPKNYCPFFSQQYPPQLRGDATNLYWFRDNVFDYVFSSHLIEDFTREQQALIFREWCRVVKPGGHLVILAPERGRWKAALAAGQPPNMAHKNEPKIGEFSELIKQQGGWDVVEDRFCDEKDYGMLFVARKHQ